MELFFRNCFIDKIKNGRKIHTVRKSTLIKPGNQIEFKVGTPNHKKHFGSGVCTYVEPVVFNCVNGDLQIVAGKKLDLVDQYTFAINDGFDSFEDLKNYFFPNHQKHTTFAFDLVLIGWNHNYYYDCGPNSLHSPTF